MPLTDAQLIERFNTRKPPTGILFKSTILDVRAADGWVRMSYNVGAEFCNPGGTIQGGIVAALLDDACAFAIIIKSGEPVFVPTLEFKTMFFGPTYPGICFVEGRCLKMGKKIAFAEADLTNEAGDLLARMSTTTAPRVLARPANLVEVPL